MCHWDGAVGLIVSVVGFMACLGVGSKTLMTFRSGLCQLSTAGTVAWWDTVGGRIGQRTEFLVIVGVASNSISCTADARQGIGNSVYTNTLKLGIGGLGVDAVTAISNASTAGGITGSGRDGGTISKSWLGDDGSLAICKNNGEVIVDVKLKQIGDVESWSDRVCNSSGGTGTNTRNIGTVDAIRSDTSVELIVQEDLVVPTKICASVVCVSTEQGTDLTTGFGGSGNTTGIAGRRRDTCGCVASVHTGTLWVCRKTGG